MRHVCLLLSYCLASLGVSATESSKESSKGRQNAMVNNSVSVSRADLRPSSSTRGSNRGASSSSTSQRQRSPTRKNDQRGVSAAAQQIPPTTRSRSPSPLWWTAHWRETSPAAESTSPTTRSRSPSPASQPMSPASRSRNPSPSPSILPARPRLRAENFLPIANGPIRLQRAQIQRPRVASRSRSGPEILPYTPTPSGIISGHPNSAIVVVKGPGYMETQTSDGVIEFAHVHPGEYDHISIHDKLGGYALGRTERGGHAVAAATGNAAAAYAAVHHTATGHVETHSGPSETFRQVEPGSEYRKHARGDNTGSVKSAALASVQGRGQVTAVSMEREVNQNILG